MEIPKNIKSLLKAPGLKNSPMHRLCRVLKGPGCYICGLCGKRYNNPNDAWRCLTSNGLSLTSLPVIATKNNTQTYLCILCGKTYATQPDAALCVMRDLRTARFPRALGEHLNSLFAGLAEQAEKTRRDKLVSRPGILGSPLPKNQAAYRPPEKKGPSEPTPSLPELSDDDSGGAEQDLMVAQEPSIDAAPPEQAPEEPGTSGDPMDHEADILTRPAEIEKPILYRKPGQKPFTRDNAQYRCSVCNEKFFTKMEVETHFEEHPLMDTV
ncbi:hypothetical protein [Silvanigrella aquatica]|uniref:C2H2-type domain-containing protein n=1 Tax=Silvanigrella aquatica TaxID=1915309 RepID=A0A1L4D145_9BACT|nr:hypothetical protein [Silvanigrella aquatica]APJ03916.1 hypothetical protein AXG55_08365 [Silvanigrella aquatica]